MLIVLLFEIISRFVILEGSDLSFMLLTFYLILNLSLSLTFYLILKPGILLA